MRGTHYVRGGRGYFILNQFVKQEDPELLKKLTSKWIAVTEETYLYYFQIEQAWYEHAELHVSARGPVKAIWMLSDHWEAQLAECAAQAKNEDKQI